MCMECEKPSWLRDAFCYNVDPINYVGYAQFNASDYTFNELDLDIPYV